MGLYMNIDWYSTNMARKREQVPTLNVNSPENLPNHDRNTIIKN
jgi:hypothetical protein